MPLGVASFVSTTGKALNSSQRPGGSEHQFHRSLGVGAQLWRPFVGVVETAAGRRRSGSAHVQTSWVAGFAGCIALEIAHDDRIADRGQGRLQLGRPGTLLLHQALQLGL